MTADPGGAAPPPGSRGEDHPVPATPRPAATVVVMRHGPDGPEVLLTRRPATMAFGPGLHVFPGGAVDRADHDPSLLARLRDGDALPALHGPPFAAAAIRELFEEAGVLLASDPDGRPADAVAFRRSAMDAGSFQAAVTASGLELRADWLVPLSRWVTPPVVARRFDARFFVAWLPQGATPAFDPTEVAGHAWMVPEAALTAMAEGRIELWMPTSTTLQQLAGALDLADVRRHLAPSGHGSREPLVDRPLPLLTRIGFAGAGAIEGQTVDSFLVGRRRLAIVDPGDPSDEAIDAIIATAAALGGHLEAVLLSAPVADHAAGAESLALRLGIPVRASTAARRVLASEVDPTADGALLDVADTPIRVLATPGTHPDHLAYELPQAGAVLVGDLYGPGPSRALPAPVDEPSLARSRARVEALPSRTRLGAHR
jgi:glyoxylase-like metal-dependent hydrolase (beta-lactamase superfamily II)/8-oxo-dGTP pyrophosphatase MutT (NUDIX family)